MPYKLAFEKSKIINENSTNQQNSQEHSSVLTYVIEYLLISCKEQGIIFFYVSLEDFFEKQNDCIDSTPPTNQQEAVDMKLTIRLCYCKRGQSGFTATRLEWSIMNLHELYHLTHNPHQGCTRIGQT